MELADTIRLKCPGCGSVLNAKAELLGQMRNCPKCGTQVPIWPDEEKADPPAAPDPDASTTAAAQLAQPPASGLPFRHWPDRLVRQHHYLICDKARIVAAWENNGKGWLLKTHTGLISAARNREQIPAHGEFKLIELQIEHGDGGRRLVGIRCYQLVSRWALTCLDKGDDPIMGKIAGLAGLTQDQKSIVRTAIKEQFMPEIWQDAAQVMQFLANSDHQSPGTE